MNIYEALNYINRFPDYDTIKKDASRFRMLMDALGNPQNKLKIVTVTGSHGKSSVTRMISSALYNSGYRTGEYITPCTSSLCDCIHANGANLSDEELGFVVSEIAPIIDSLGFECTRREISMAIALICIAAKKCDIAVIEADSGIMYGLAEALGTTLLSVITTAEEDEQVIRGYACALKEDVSAVIAHSGKRLARNIINGMTVKGSGIFSSPSHFKLRIKQEGIGGSTFTYKGNKYICSMAGRHQLENALTAIEAAQILRKIGYSAITYSKIFDAVKETILPSRCQAVSTENPAIIIDSADSPERMKALADFIRTLPEEPKIMVCGMTEDNDWQAALGFITRYIDVALCVDGFAPDSVFAPKLTEVFREAQEINLKNAMPRAIALAGEKGLVIAAGSPKLAPSIRKMM